jgi:hypothetical protein
MVAVPYLADAAPVYGNSCALFYRSDVAAGTKSVKLQWSNNFGTGSSMDRVMIVTANIH